VNVQYHPGVEQEVAEALKRYDDVSSLRGDEFKKELRHFNVEIPFMRLLRSAVLLVSVAVGSLNAPSGYAQGTIVYVVPPQPVVMTGIYGVPWSSDFDLDGDGVQDYRFDNDGAVFYVRPFGSNRQIAYPAVPPDMGSYLTHLFAGAAVGSSLNPILGEWVDSASPNQGWHSGISYQFNVGGGGTFYRKIAYMGIDFLAADGGRHFGWIKIDCSQSVAGGLLTEWAWAASPGQSIAAGQIPEPSTWDFSLIGLLSTAFLRRRFRAA
jgi:hypothetical protein